MSSATVVQGDRFANEPEDASGGFQAGFSEFVPYEFLFREKTSWRFLRSPHSSVALTGAGHGLPQGCWRSARFWGRIPEKWRLRRGWRWERMRRAGGRLRSGPQSSFLLLSVLCTEAKKSTTSLAVFLGLSITTECPQFSRSSTWQLGMDLASMSAPDTSSTCRTRAETRWKRFRHLGALGGQTPRRPQAWFWGTEPFKC